MKVRELHCQRWEDIGVTRCILGWLNYSKGSYKQVKCKQGGGARIVQYPIEEGQTVQSLLTLGKKLFFPEGRSQFGLLSEMNVHLCQFDGTEISSFKARNGEECS